MFRFTRTLYETKQIGLKKGLYMGICQAFSQMLIYLSFAITFWCRNLTKDRIDKIFLSQWII